MGLAFWRRKKGAADAAPKRATRTPIPNDDEAGGRGDPTAALRIRARRRLIGAAALLLTAAIIVPMLLDPEPRPVPDNIPIDVPSEKTPFNPRLSLPPVPAPESAPVAPPDTKAEEPAKADDKAQRAADDKKLEEQRAKSLLEGKSTDAKSALPATTKSGRYAVQAAAPASETAALELVDRLKNSGFAPYTEKVETKDGTRHRVRVGPYATREDAEKARARLRTLGIGANLVVL
jgi:DedD protein